MGKALFDINSCRAKATGVDDLVDCLAQQQARFCGHALPFGNVIFCLHPQKKDFVENTKKQKNLDKSKSENQK